MSLVSSPVIGLEQIQREAFYVLFDQLNSGISAVNTEMVDSDIEFASHTGRTYEVITVETVDAEHFHEGHRPSLIEAPISDYPNCSVWTDRAAASDESDEYDHSQIFVTTLNVEVMVRANPEEGETLVNKRVLRTIEAVHFVLMANSTLGGIVSQISQEPTIDVSEVFTRKERSAYGAEHYWQAGRLKYLITKTSNIGSDSTFTIDYPGIDQV